MTIITEDNIDNYDQEELFLELKPVEFFETIFHENADDKIYYWVNEKEYDNYTDGRQWIAAISLVDVNKGYSFNIPDENILDIEWGGKIRLISDFPEITI